VSIRNISKAVLFFECNAFRLTLRGYVASVVKYLDIIAFKHYINTVWKILSSIWYLS